MKHLIEIVLANKALFSALAALFISELLPFLPTKANGWAQLALGVLKKQTPPPLPPAQP